MIEVIGLFGGVCYLIAFIEVASGKWKGKSFWYEAFNLLGSLALGYYAIRKQAYMNIVLNVVWGVVALYTIRHIVQRHRTRKTIRKKYHGRKK